MVDYISVETAERIMYPNMTGGSNLISRGLLRDNNIN
jgi:hypothetical protein